MTPQNQSASLVSDFNYASAVTLTLEKSAGVRPDPGSSGVIHGVNYYGGGGRTPTLTDAHGNTWAPVHYEVPVEAGGNAKLLFWLCDDIQYTSSDPLEIDIGATAYPVAMSLGWFVFAEKVAFDTVPVDALSAATTSLSLTTLDLEHENDWIFTQLHPETYAGAAITLPYAYTSGGVENGWDPGLPYAAAHRPVVSGSAPQGAIWEFASAPLVCGQILALYDLNPGGSVDITIQGFGELPTSYPISLARLSPPSASLVPAGTQTFTLYDQNDVPVIGANVTADGLYLSDDVTDANGQVEVEAVTRGTYTLRTTYSDVASPLTQRSAVITVAQLEPVNPTRLLATAHPSIQGRIDLAWSDNSGNETGFEVQVAPDASGVPGVWAALASLGAGVVVYSHTGLPAATRRWYRVRAINGSGNSLWSNYSSAQTIPAPSAAPSIAIVEQGVTLPDGSNVRVFMVLDQDGSPVDFANASVSRPGYVVTPKKVVDGALPVAPVGVGVATITVTYDHPTAGLLTATTVVTVTPA